MARGRKQLGNPQDDTGKLGDIVTTTLQRRGGEKRKVFWKVKQMKEVTIGGNLFPWKFRTPSSDCFTTDNNSTFAFQHFFCLWLIHICISSHGSYQLITFRKWYSSSWWREQMQKGSLGASSKCVHGFAKIRKNYQTHFYFEKSADRCAGVQSFLKMRWKQLWNVKNRGKW